MIASEYNIQDRMIPSKIEAQNRVKLGMKSAANYSKKSQFQHWHQGTQKIITGKNTTTKGFVYYTLLKKETGYAHAGDGRKLTLILKPLRKLARGLQGFR